MCSHYMKGFWPVHLLVAKAIQRFKTSPFQIKNIAASLHTKKKKKKRKEIEKKRNRNEMGYR